MPTKTTNIRPVRIPDPDVDEAMEKGKTYGLDEFSAVVRLALKKLRSKKPPHEAGA